MTMTLDGTLGITATGSLTGLTTPITAAQGGTGAATLTANNVLLGNGTSAVTFVAPSTSGNLLTSNGTTWASTAPAASGGMTLLGTLTTTSGTTQTLSSLTLTSYKYLFITIQNVSFNAAAALYKESNAIRISRDTGVAGESVWGIILVDLSTGTFGTTSAITTSSSGELGANGVTTTGRVDWSTATTSLVFSGGSGGISFDSGTIKVYGVA